MNEKTKRMKEANYFNKDGDCYVHIEMKGGKDCQMIMAGDGLALLHGITGAVHRLGVLSNNSFLETLEKINEYYTTTDGETVTEIIGRIK